MIPPYLRFISPSTTRKEGTVTTQDAMETRQLILELCYEAGETGPDDDIVDEWQGDHGCCCNLNAEDAARGNVAVVNQIRSCMGLRVTS